MSTAERELSVGTIGWRDLTVPDAEAIRDFYRDVVGWESSPLDMGGYSDFVMLAPGGDGVAGICHARGANANIPPQWLIYIVVADLERSIARCIERGGEVVAEPRSAGDGRFCVIRDPAGAVCALYQTAAAAG
ncbi:MAG TPA: VOC family protein [Longimicrobiales bacterium]